jgi:hypothetical protein
VQRKRKSRCYNFCVCCDGISVGGRGNWEEREFLELNEKHTRVSYCKNAHSFCELFYMYGLFSCVNI